MAYTERRLPHWDIIGCPLFVTFRLHGSLPANRTFLPARMTSGQSFRTMDRILGNARTGPLHLRVPQIAELVMQALLDGDRKLHRYELHAFVVMPNHVHMLATPHIAAAKWLGPLKGFTAHEANCILGRRGKFWQDESYDHLVESDAEFNHISGYIENNPVSAGLVLSPEDFRWSSATPPEGRLQPGLAAPQRA